MPEHQIVINLKGEQFEKVQRLSRLAGSNSVSAFVKERVLALLGVEGEATEQSALQEPSAQQIQEISQELSRMHRELQAFIAESLSSSSPGEAGEDSAYFEGDLTEQAYEAYRSLQQAINEELYGTTTGGDSQQAETAEDINIFSQMAAITNNQTADPDNPGQAGIYTNRPAESVFLPQQIAYPAQPNDELEDLAERAFAISPRLGTDTPGSTQSQGFRKPQKDDPLQDLLDDTIIEQAEKQRMAQAGGPAPTDPYQGGMVYAFDEPAPAQLTSNPVTPVEKEDSSPELNSYAIPPEELIAPATHVEQTEAASEAPVLDYEPDSTDDSQEQPNEDVQETMYTVYSPSDEKEMEESQSTVSTQDTNDSTKNDDDDENVQPPSANSLPPDPYFLAAGPPPKRKRPVDSEDDSQGDERISGGPPPKRRKK